MVLAGVNDVYSKSSDLLNAFLGVNISVSQVYRVTDCIGNQLIPDLTKEIDHPPLQENQRVYTSMDGSMVQMDQGWQEIKLGGRRAVVFSEKIPGQKMAQKKRAKYATSLKSPRIVVILAHVQILLQSLRQA